MKVFLKVLSVLLIISVDCESLKVDCLYKAGPPYECTIQNTCLINSEDHRDITAVRGFHLSGKTNDDVTRFFADSKNTINYFPRGILKYFKNINYVNFEYSKLKRVRKEDLKEFGNKLKTLRLPHNQIEFIEENLFIFNENLVYINFYGNKIKHVENGVFDHLSNLDELYLHGNLCTADSDAASDRSKLITAIRSIEEKCKDQGFLYLQEKNAEIKFLMEKIEKLEQKINNCIAY